jgi:hypothetical protein
MSAEMTDSEESPQLRAANEARAFALAAEIRKRFTSEDEDEIVIAMVDVKIEMGASLLDVEEALFRLRLRRALVNRVFQKWSLISSVWPKIEGAAQPTEPRE